jgi:hypothetical protein
MEKELKDLLENQVLGDETKQALQEAFENKIKILETRLQEDYIARYNHDKGVLVEAMDRMLSDAIRTELVEFAEDRAALISQRATLSKATRIAKSVYERKVTKHTKLLNEYIARQLRDELKEFAIERKTLVTERKNMAKEVQMIKENNRVQLANRVNKLESFVIKNLSEEIAEFAQDKKALTEQRVKLARIGKRQLAETRNNFVSKATKVVSRTLNEVIKNELVQWRDDIKVARENNFGRRIFEAVASEYMASYLSEGSEVKKLQAQLLENQRKISNARNAVKQQQKLVEQANSVAQTATNRIQRMTIINELLNPLGREKKTIMGDLLKDIKTANLKEAFNRYLPTVGNTTNTTNTKMPLSENTQTHRVTGVTGNRLINETQTQAEIEQSDDIGKILYLAGVNN